MTGRVSKHHRDWLAAEQADVEEAAEAALHEMFSACPPVEPRADFVDRVVHAAWAARARRRRLDLMARVATGVVVVVSGVVSGVAALYVAGLPAMTFAARASLDVTQAIVWVVLLFAHALEGWWIAGRAAAALAEALVTPSTLAVLLTLELLGMSGIYALNRLGGDARGRDDAAEG